MSCRILFLVSHVPQRGALGAEMLDELLIGAAFEQRVSLLFVGDGVYHLADATSGSSARGFRALPTYDVTDVFVERAAVKARNLDPERFVIPARSLAPSAIRRLIATQDVVVPD